MVTFKRLIAIMLFDKVDLLDVTGPAEVFFLLQREMTEPTGYEVILVAETLIPVQTSSGVRIFADATFEQIVQRKIDTLIIPGSVYTNEQGKITATVEPLIVAWVKRLAGQTRRIASVCVGAHILAEAGLLDGKRATTHWSTAKQLAETYPNVTADANPIFIQQNNIWTGAGLTACLDLSLALVADDFGDKIALQVARQLVMFLKRPSGQSQFSTLLEPMSSSDRIEKLRHYIFNHIEQPLTIAVLAELAHLSERQLTRLFKKELNMTPALYIETIRIERARNHLENTHESLEQIAAGCGFNSVSTLTRAFRRTLNVTPAEYRKQFK